MVRIPVRREAGGALDATRRRGDRTSSQVGAAVGALRRIRHQGGVRLADWSGVAAPPTRPKICTIHAWIENAPPGVFSDAASRRCVASARRARSSRCRATRRSRRSRSALHAQGVRFVNIAGNDEILVTAIGPAATCHQLRRPPRLGGPDAAGRRITTRARFALRVPVASLHEVMTRLRAGSIASNTSMTTESRHATGAGAAPSVCWPPGSSVLPCCIYPVRKMVAVRRRIRPDRKTARRSSRIRRRPPSRRFACRQSGTLRWTQRGGTINDASCLNRTPVHGIVAIRSVDDIRNALPFARGQRIEGRRGRRASTAWAARRSRAGALVLDMRPFNRMSLDESRQVLTRRERRDVARHPDAAASDVRRQSDAVHRHLHRRRIDLGQRARHGPPIGIGGTHDPRDAGDAGRRVDPERQPEPKTRSCSRWSSAATACSASSSTSISRSRRTSSTSRAVAILDYQQFPEVFASEIQPDATYGLLYGHLSTAPQSFLQEMILYTYREVPAAGATIAPLGEVSQIKLRRLVFNLSSQGSLAMRLKWFAEKHLEPRMESCTVSRNQALGEAEACLVSRNEPMHDSVPYLQNALRRLHRHPARILHPARELRPLHRRSAPDVAVLEREPAERLGPHRSPRRHGALLRAGG